LEQSILDPDEEVDVRKDKNIVWDGNPVADLLAKWKSKP